MLTHLLGFSVYTLAMVGVIFLSLVVYKKATQNSIKSGRGILKVEEFLSIAPRKALMVVRVRNERFLLASDPEETKLISRLESSKFQIEQEEFEEKIEAANSLYEPVISPRAYEPLINNRPDLNRDSGAFDKSETKPPMMRELLRKLGK